MSKYFFVLLIFECSITQAQDFVFKRPKNIKFEVELLDSWTEIPTLLLDTVKISYFDKQGNLVKEIHKSHGRMSWIYAYKYNGSGNKIEFKDYGRESCQIIQDSLSGKEIETCLWDSTTVMQVEKYFYKNGMLVKSDNYSDGETLSYSFEFEYDPQKRLIKETRHFYPEKNILVYFKPRSTEIDSNYVRQTKTITYVKTCSYSKDLRRCIYSDSTGIKSIDSTIYKKGLVTKLISFDLYGKILKEQKYKYNTNLQLVELSIVKTGFDSYGNETDETPGNFRINYRYDIYGFLNLRLHYTNERISRRYSYIRR